MIGTDAVRTQFWHSQKAAALPPGAKAQNTRIISDVPPPPVQFGQNRYYDEKMLPKRATSKRTCRARAIAGMPSFKANRRRTKAAVDERVFRREAFHNSLFFDSFLPASGAGSAVRKTTLSGVSHTVLSLPEARAALSIETSISPKTFTSCRRGQHFRNSSQRYSR